MPRRSATTPWPSPGCSSPKQFGPPVRPYQPDGLWVKVGGERVDYVVSPGEDRYRRGIYVVWKRGAPYPSFVNFDATARLACTVKRSRSNTPLQALTLLNDPVYVEAAQALARRVARRAAGRRRRRADRPRVPALPEPRAVGRRGAIAATAVRRSSCRLPRRPEAHASWSATCDCRRASPPRSSPPGTPSRRRC